MLRPDEVKLVAESKKSENLNFRTFLKKRAKEKVLDKHFSNLHKELFKDYDCSQCNNCCKQYQSNFNNEKDIENAAKILNISNLEFMETYLEKDETSNDLRSKHLPCDFYTEKGCLLKDNKPVDCKEYPYTNNPNRLRSLYSILGVVEVCPVAFEILERLKRIYGFIYKKQEKEV